MWLGCFTVCTTACWPETCAAARNSALDELYAVKCLHGAGVDLFCPIEPHKATRDILAPFSLIARAKPSNASTRSRYSRNGLVGPKARCIAIAGLSPDHSEDQHKIAPQ